MSSAIPVAEFGQQIKINKLKETPTKNGDLPIFRDDTFNFVRHLTGSEETKNNFTVIKTYFEKDKITGREKEKREVKDFVGTISNLYSSLLDYNKNGFCVFMVVNACDGRRAAENIKSVRACFFDDDSGQNIEYPIRPSILVSSARGPHGYFLFNEQIPLDQFSLIQESISKKLRTDPSVKDLPRLMRVPGFAHMKDSSNPAPVRLIEVSDCRYSFKEIKEAFPLTPKEFPKIVNEVSLREIDIEFFEWAKKLPRQEGVENTLGGRNKTALILVREGLGRKLSKETISEALSVYCLESGLAEDEVSDMLERQEKENGIKNFAAFFSKPTKGKVSTTRLAEEYLKSRGYISLDGIPQLAYWRGDYFHYDGTRYKKIQTIDLKADIVSFIQESIEFKEKYKRVWIDDIATYLTGVFHISSDIEPGADLNDLKKNKNLVFLKNGIIHLNPENDWSAEFGSHDRRYFSQVVLPYEYNLEATCEKFLTVLSEIVPDQSTREFLQEWFGYNLVHDTSQSKFVVLLGEGANGKTVLLSVLSAMIGKENISAVPLESFNAVRTFPIAVTIGKLANIVDEMGPLKGVEATLKQYISGSLMNVEKKGKDGSEQRPTARLTFATNSLPAFHDRSDGLWRRLVVVPMLKQILDESKQDKRLSKMEFWESSGELSGILNWALIGLQRLMRRGYFIEPSASGNFKNDFRNDCDQVVSFVEERLTEEVGSTVGATTLYSEYIRYSNLNGFQPVSASAFANAVRKAFPNAVKSKNPQPLGDHCRQRVWSGIKLGGEF